MKIEKLKNRQAYFNGNFKTHSEGEDDKFIEGYFAVFDSETQIWDGWFEKIKRGAFDNSIKNNDIRCLFNHDSGFVLGRTSNKTLELRSDDKGLWGKVKINTADSGAMDVYSRVQRGDISGCSFGFCPVKEEYEDRENGVLCTVEEADTMEVSICTFPAYEQTEVQARQKEYSKTKEKTIEQKRHDLKKKLEGIKC